MAKIRANKRHPIQGVAEHVGGSQRQGQGRRNRHHDDDGLSASQGQGHEHDDGQGGDPQVLHQLGRFLVGREAVVPGLGDLACWTGITGPLKLGHALVEIGDQLDGVGAGLLGHRHRHRGHIQSRGQMLFGTRGARHDPDIVRRLIGAIDDGGHISQIDWPSAVDSDDCGGYLVCRAKEAADLHLGLDIGAGERSGRKSPVQTRQGLVHLQWRET